LPAARGRGLLRMVLVVLTIASGFGLILAPRASAAVPAPSRCEVKATALTAPPARAVTAGARIPRPDDDERLDVPPSSLSHQDQRDTTQRVDHAVARSRPRLLGEGTLWQTVLLGLGLALTAAVLAADRLVGALALPVLPPSTGPPLGLLPLEV
jgi:hypothetical protein